MITARIVMLVAEAARSQARARRWMDAAGALVRHARLPINPAGR
jgi:hypothetical protein